MKMFEIEIDDRLIAYAKRFGMDYAACDHSGLVFLSREKPELCTNKEEKWEFSSVNFWPVGYTDSPVKQFISI